MLSKDTHFILSIRPIWEYAFGEFAKDARLKMISYSTLNRYLNAMNLPNNHLPK